LRARAISSARSRKQTVKSRKPAGLAETGFFPRNDGNNRRIVRALPPSPMPIAR
jgi:hypothetical protein